MKRAVTINCAEDEVELALAVADEARKIGLPLERAGKAQLHPAH
jgi:hypothetical protein